VFYIFKKIYINSVALFRGYITEQRLRTTDLRYSRVYTEISQNVWSWKSWFKVMERSWKGHGNPLVKEEFNTPSTNQMSGCTFNITASWFLASIPIYSSVADCDTRDVQQANERRLFHMWLHRLSSLRCNSMSPLPVMVLSVRFNYYFIPSAQPCRQTEPYRCSTVGGRRCIPEQ